MSLRKAEQNTGPGTVSEFWKMGPNSMERCVTRTARGSGIGTVSFRVHGTTSQSRASTSQRFRHRPVSRLRLNCRALWASGPDTVCRGAMFRSEVRARTVSAETALRCLDRLSELHAGGPTPAMDEGLVDPTIAVDQLILWRGREASKFGRNLSIGPGS